MSKTWKEKIGKRLMKHVAATTSRSTLAEVKNNIAAQQKGGDVCWECLAIANKLSISNQPMENRK